MSKSPDILNDQMPSASTITSPTEGRFSTFIHHPTTRRATDTGLRAIGVAALLGGAAIVEKVFLNNSQPGISNAPKVEAADSDCIINRFMAVGYEYADHPTKANREGIIDFVDFYIGAYQGGEVSLYVLEDPNDSKSKRTEIARGNMEVVGGDHAEAIFPSDFNMALKTKPNVVGPRGKKAVQIRASSHGDQIRSSIDPSLPVEVNVVVTCAEEDAGREPGLGYAYFGRYTTTESLKQAAKKPKIYSIGSKLDKRVREVFKRAIGLTPFGENPENNARILKDNLKDMETHAAEVRAKEKEDALKTNPALATTPNPAKTAAPTSAGTPRPAATPTAGSGTTTNPEQPQVAALVATATKITADYNQTRNRVNDLTKQNAELTGSKEQLAQEKTELEADYNKLGRDKDDASVAYQNTIRNLKLQLAGTEYDKWIGAGLGVGALILLVVVAVIGREGVTDIRRRRGP